MNITATIVRVPFTTICRSISAGVKSENRLSVWIYLGIIQVADQSGLRHNENPIAHQSLRQFGAYDDDGPTVRSIQASYGDVMTHDEFFELIDRS